MAEIASVVRRKLLNIFGDDALAWFDCSYVVDWIVASIAWAISWWIKFRPPFERDFDLDDPLISHKHRSNQIGGSMNMMVAVFVPLSTVVVVGTLRTSAMDIHHGLLSLYSGSGFTALITEFLKNRVGRLRPDFLSRCKWREAAKACTGNIETVQDGRRSFPSGHSSTAFAGMTFLSLFLAGSTGAWLFSNPTVRQSFSSSRIGRLCLTLFPVAYATWVAVSRLEDYRHHKEDVIVGSLLGVFTSGTCYFIYWPNPFHSQNSSGTQEVSRPRDVYGGGNTRILHRDYNYELAGMEQGDVPV